MTTKERLVVDAARHDDEPRPFGRVRQFWAAHPRLTDLIIMFACLLLGNPLLVLLRADDGFIGLSTAQIGVGLSVSVATIALYWRRKHPILVFIAVILSTLATITVGVSTTTFALVVAMYTVTVYTKPRAAWWVFGYSMLATLAVTVVFSLITGSRFDIPDPYVIMVAVILLIGLLLGSNVYGIRRYQNALLERSRQLVVESTQREELARSAERSRIAREMHDVVSHSLTVVVALAEGAGATSDRERATLATNAIASTARNALSEMRSMLGVLRSDDEGAPLAPLATQSIDTIVRLAREAGYPVTVKTSGTRVLTSAQSLAVSRVVQEALTNAMRHSDATYIRVAVEHEQTHTRITIENDAPRAATSQGGFGIRGLRERVEHVSGTMTAGLTNRSTWLVAALIPRGIDEEQTGEPGV